MDTQNKTSNDSGIEQYSTRVEDKINGVERHTHNGADSPKVRTIDLQKAPFGQFFLDSIGGGALTGGNASGVPPIPSPVPQLVLVPEIVADGSGGTKYILMPTISSKNDVNEWLTEISQWLEELKNRQEAIVNSLERNGFARTTEVINSELNRYTDFGDFPSTSTSGEYYADDSTLIIYVWNDDTLEYEITDMGWYSAYKYEI